MHLPVSLRANLAIDARAVRDRIAARKGLPEFPGIGQIGCKETHAGQFVNGFVAHILAACNQQRLVASRQKLARQVATYEPRSAGNCNSRLVSPMKVVVS